VADVNQRVRTIIESMGGVVLNVDNWGKRKLAYEIKKELKGIYLYWQYLGSADVVTEFERNMRMLDPVIRYMTVVCQRDVDPKGRESQVNDETYQKAATTAADEEELMLRRTDESSEGDGEGEGGDEDDDVEFSAGPEVAAAPEAAGPASSDDTSDSEDK
jgi:small subunit ribosomal protein S6